MAENMKYYEMFREVPKEAQKPIGGGRLKGMTDINPMWRIKALTEAFGPVGIGWYYKISDKHIETVGTESAAFVDIELYIKVNGEWSMPIIGTGGSSFVTIERSGNAYMSDECYKMALTDAISIAFKALGGAGNIYFAKDRTKYDVKTDADTKAPADNVTPIKQPKTTDTTKVSVQQLTAAMAKKGITQEQIFETYKRDVKDIVEVKKKTCTDLKFLPQEYKLKYFNMCK